MRQTTKLFQVGVNTTTPLRSHFSSLKHNSDLQTDTLALGMILIQNAVVSDFCDILTLDISKLRTFEFAENRRYAFFALKNATWLVIDFNSVSVRGFGAPLTDILFLEVSNEYLVLGDTKTVITFSPIMEKQCQTCSLPLISCLVNFEDEILDIDVKMLDGKTYLFVMLWKLGNTRIIIYQLNACASPLAPLVTFTLNGVQDRNVWFTLHDHWFNYTTQIEAGKSNQRQLIMIYTFQQVNIIEFIPTAGSQFSINFGTPELYNFYVAPPGLIIQDVTIIEERMRRIKFQNSTCDMIDGLPAQNLYLAVAVGMKNGPPMLQLIHLKEFGEFSLLNTRSTLNPGDRPQFCPNQYFDGVYCRNRHIQSIPMAEEIVIMKQQFLGEIRGALNGTTRCEPLRQYSPDRYDQCRAQESRFQCDLQYFQNVTSNVLSQMFDRSMYTVLFVATKETDKVLIYGIQPQFCSDDLLIIQKLNEVSFLGDITDIHVSKNGQHLLASIERDKWELDSMLRYQEICSKLALDPNNVFLAAYRDSCSKTPPMVIDLNQFGQYASLCFPGTYCPSLTQNLITQVKEKHYTFRPNSEVLCYPGHYCMQGVKLDCPQGFQCPFFGMTRPEKCDKDASLTTSCGTGKLVAPNVCPDGLICTVPYSPGFPSAPGYFAGHDTTGKRVVQNCIPGEYCNLGRSLAKGRSDLLCPEKTVCPTPATMTPSICSCSVGNCSYCPPGTFVETLCPAGFKCNPSKTPQIFNCSRTDFCPNGTVVPLTCPEKHYCPTPDRKLICPYGHFCKVGTTSPTPCPIPFFCPEGTQTDPVNFLGILLDVGVIMLVLVLYGIASLILYFYRKYREKRRKMLADGLLRSETQIKMKMRDSTSAPMTNCYLDIRFENLGLKLKGTGATVLNNVSGIVKSGRVCAVMGPSGCGKSTFLTTLSGRAFYGDQTGDIYINDVKDSLTNYPNLIGFVPQEDIMLRTMTVEDILFFSAYSRLDWKTSRELVTRIVDKVIKQLGLEEIRYSVIGDELKRGISGGQRKRVNIGMELVCRPVVLCLDEPTSGLDSSSSMEVCGALSRIAKTGITVVTVIHQPRYEIFTMIDDVLLLGKGGRVVYHGESKKALGYFEGLGFKCPEHVNPPDFFMDVISGEIPRQGDPDFVKDDLFELWKQSNIKIEPSDYEKTRTAREESRSRKTLFITQLWLCFFRAFKQQFKDLGGFFLDNMLFFISGLFTGMTFYQSSYIGPLPAEVIEQCPISLRPLCGIPQKDVIIMIAGASSLALSLSATIAALKVFGNEIAVFRREHESGMSTIAYFLSKNLVQIFSILTAPLVYLSIFYSLFVPRGSFISYYFLLMEVVFIGYGFGYLISVTCGQYQQLAAIIMTMIFFNFNGTTPTLNQLKEMPFPLFCMPYLSYLRWMQEAIYLIEIQKYENVYNIKTGMDILDYKFDNLIPNIFIALSFGIAVRILAYFCLVASAPNSYFNQGLNFIFSIPSRIKKMKCCQKKTKEALGESLIDNDSLKRMPSINVTKNIQILPSEEYYVKKNVGNDKIAEVDEDEVTPYE